MKSRVGQAKLQGEPAKLWTQYKWPAVGAACLIVLIVAANIGLSEYRGWANEQSALRLQAVYSSVSKGFARTYRNRMEKLKATLRLDRLAGRVGNEGAEAINATLANLVSTEKMLLGARFVAPGSTDIDRSSYPPLGYAALEMLRKFEETRRPVSPVVLFFGSERQQIAALHPLKDGNTVVGYVLAAYNLAVIEGALTEVASIGRDLYVEVTQPLPKGKPLKLAVFGDSSLRQGPEALRRPVSGTSWRLALWQRGTAAAKGDDIEPYLWFGLGVLAAIIIGGAGFSFWRRHTGATSDQLENTAASPFSILGQGGAQDVDVFDKAATDGGHPERLESPSSSLQEEGEGVEHPDYADDGVPDGDDPEAGTEPLPSSAEEADAELTEVASSMDATGGTLPPASVFRAYDIRGVIGTDFGAEHFRELGRAIGSEAHARRQQTIVIARDGRLSSPELHEAVVGGIRDTGRDVIDIGMVPTPLLYFAAYHLKTGSGVMVTASHNPPEYNGLKVMLGEETLSGEDVTALRARLEGGVLEEGEGNFQEMDLQSEYIRRVSEDIPVALGNAFRLVLDCGNGAASTVAPKLFRALGHDVVELYCDVDGAFPNRDPDTSDPKNLQALVAAVQENEADLGLGFDGDGDRIAVVDGGGNIIFPDRLMMLFARDILSRSPGSKIIYDVKCSNRLGVIISKLGGTPIMGRTGHSYLKKQLKAEGAELAGDLSGHIFFQERWYGFDDAMYAGARLLEILMGMKQSPADVLSKLPTGVGTAEIRIDMQEGDHLQFMQEFAVSANFPGAEVSTLDGVRADYADGWGLVRASNTTPALTLRFEANSEESLGRIQTHFKELIHGVDASLTLPF